MISRPLWKGEAPRLTFRSGTAARQAVDSAFGQGFDFLPHEAALGEHIRRIILVPPGRETWARALKRWLGRSMLGVLIGWRTPEWRVPGDLREVRDPRDLDARHDLRQSCSKHRRRRRAERRRCVDYAVFGLSHEEELSEIIDLDHGAPSHGWFGRLFGDADEAVAALALTTRRYAGASTWTPPER